MALNVVTPQFRGVFVALFKPSKPKSAPPEQEAKYSIKAAFPPTTDLSALKAAAKAAAEEKWGDKIPKALRSPFRTNDELENPIPQIGDDWVVMTFSSKPDKFSAARNLVDSDRQPITDETDAYSGAWYRAEVRASAYENAGNKGVSFYLQNVQKLRDDEAIGPVRQAASSVFDPVPSEGAKKPSSVADLFD